MSQSIDSIPLDRENICVLNKRSLQKPVYRVKCRKLRHKETGQIIEVVQEYQSFSTMYDYVQMGDFWMKEKQVKIEELMEKLREKVLGDVQEIDCKEMELGVGMLLREFNLTPPIRDLLVNTGQKQDPNVSAISISISFGDPIPTHPLVNPPSQLSTPPSSSLLATRPALYEQYLSKYALYSKLVSYLQKRPCWLRNVLLTHLKQDGFPLIKQYEFKYTLRYLCYTYKNGPWKSTYCAFGYEPLKTATAVIYQHIAVKLKKKQAGDYQEKVEEDLYDPTLGEVSRRCVRGYQLCDIQEEKIKEVLNGRLMVGGEQECTKEYGWLSKKEFANVVAVVKAKVREQGEVI